VDDADGVGSLMAEDPSVTEVSPGELILEHEGRRFRLFVAVDGDTRWIFFDGRVSVVEFDRAAGLKPGATTTSATTTRATRRPGAAVTGALSAPMPATVLRIQTTPGAVVKKGDTLLVLEAMKMELPLRSTQDGTVAAVHCTEGQLVQPGVTLVEFRGD
jgi:biotin carboxyl carrier protein